MDGDGTAAEDERPNNGQRAAAAAAVVSSSSSLPHLNADETAGGCGGGNDSGVDVTPAVSCDSSLASGCYDPCKSQPSSPNDTTGPSSLPCYSMAAAVGGSRPSTPTWRRTKFANNNAMMSSSFHFESTVGNRNSPPPSSSSSSKKTDLNAAAKQSKISTVKKLVGAYDTGKSSSSPLDRYACTLPRRRRKSKENLATSAVVVAAAAGSTAAIAAAVTPPKTPSLNRAASLRRKHIEQGALAAAAAAAAAASGATPPPPPPPSSSSSPVNKSASAAAVPAHRTGRPPAPVKTKIYHEVCSQTCLTGDDIASVLSGNLLPPVEHRIETDDAGVQVDLVEKRINALETELKQKTEQLDCKTKEFNKQQECLKQLQEQLNHEDLDARRQIDAYSLRLCNIFQINDCTDPSPSNILEILEKHVATTCSVVDEQQNELRRLKALCTSLHKDLEKSYAAQKSLLQANQACEMESTEIQEFLQTEKTMLSDTIKELEREVKDYKERLAAKEKEASKTSHLVRISEQRRQENLSLEAKMRVMENKSRELLQQQETAAKGVVAGLSALGHRLDSYLDELVKSYSISGVDIEDQVYFNEAYTNGDSSGSDSEQQHNGSANKPEPKSLMSAIVCAIKSSAPVGWQKGKIDKNNRAANANSQQSTPLSPKPPPPPPSSSSRSPPTRLQTSESMREIQRTCSPVCKRTGSTDDLLLLSSSQADSLDGCSDLHSAESESLNNLSEAIVARQQLELSVNSGGGNAGPGNYFDLEFLEDFRAPDTDLLDQVIDLDNTVSKLLKVIAIMQTNGGKQQQQPVHQDRNEIKYTNGKHRQYGSSQSPSIHDGGNDSGCKRPSLALPMQELNANSPKTLNGIM